MSKPTKKTPPPYATYKSFRNVINGLREKGIPSHITRSTLPGSNSGKASMSATLKYLRLIDEQEQPTDALQRITQPNWDYSEWLKEVVTANYKFLTGPGFDLQTTTTDKVAEKFKEQGASGSTVTKSMSFFLSACTDAGIPVSAYVKAPAPERKANGSSRRKKKNDERGGNSDEDAGGDDYPTEGMTSITIPLHGMNDGKILLPEEMTREQWSNALKMAIFILQNYRPEYAGTALSTTEGAES